MCNNAVDCPYLANCLNADTPCCQKCANNKNHKVDYFKAVPSPYYYPYYPYTPWPYTNPYPVWTTVTTGTTANCNFHVSTA